MNIEEMYLKRSALDLRELPDEPEPGLNEMATEMAAGTEPPGAQPMSVKEFATTAADVPAGLLKGSVQGTAGIFGDIVSIGRGIAAAINPAEGESRADAFVRGMELSTGLPTTEDVQQFLDSVLGPVVPAGVTDERRREAAKTAESVGEFIGAGKAVKETAGVAQFAATSNTSKLLSTSLPSNYDDVTKLPIPPKFGGLNTKDYLFHGGIKGKLSTIGYEPYLTDAPKIDGQLPTSFSYSPQEALEYTTISGGNIVAIPKKSLNIYKGGVRNLDNAVLQNDLQILKDAGFDGVDLRSVRPGGYREVVVWNLNKVSNQAVYAPVGVVDGNVGVLDSFAAKETD